MDLDDTGVYNIGVAHYLAGEADQKVENEEGLADPFHFYHWVSSELNLGERACPSFRRLH